MLHAHTFCDLPARYVHAYKCRSNFLMSANTCKCFTDKGEFL